MEQNCIIRKLTESDLKLALYILKIRNTIKNVQDMSDGHNNHYLTNLPVKIIAFVLLSFIKKMNG